MAFVLVPVPAEHVFEVMRWVLFRSDAVAQDDPKRMAELASGATGQTRSLLEQVAQATVRNEPLRLRDVGDELGIHTDDVMVLVEAVNLDALEGGRRVIEMRGETNVGVHGQTGQVTYLSMRTDLARQTLVALKQNVAG